MGTHDHNDCETRLARVHAALVRSEQLAFAGRFAGGVLHEMNNPLEAMGNLVFLARHSSEDPDGVRTYLDLAEEQLARVQDMIRRTYFFYGSSSPPDQIDLIEVIDSALHIHRPQLTSKSIDICRSHPETARMKANRGELLHIITNLISNSVQALEEQGTLHVRVSRSHGHLHVLIADNGRGIPEEERALLFEPFSTDRRDKGAKGEQGTDLGLWVSRTLVERQNGRIRHRSSTRPGCRGTTFRISLPLSA